MPATPPSYSVTPADAIASSLSAGVFKPTLDGLSLVGGNAHTDREFAVVDSMVPWFYLLARMVMELGKGPKQQ